jgi:hypothetical protein
VICGLCGAALGLVGINIDSIVRESQHSGGELDTLFVANGLVAILRDSGSVAGLALIAYLLALHPREAPQPAAEVPSIEHPAA